MKVCLHFNLPIIISQHVNHTGHTSCPVTECSDIVGTVGILLCNLYDIQFILAHVSYRVVTFIPMILTGQFTSS